MATKHQTKITKARFVVSPFTANQMAEFGESIISMVFARWDDGMDANDGAAPPLRSAKYAKFKTQKGGADVRDLNRSGRLRRSIKVLTANQNKVSIGPTDGIHTRLKRGGQLSFSDVLTLNQRRWRMWGISPAEKAKIASMFAAGRPVRAEIVRAA